VLGDDAVADRGHGFDGCGGGGGRELGEDDGLPGGVEAVGDEVHRGEQEANVAHVVGHVHHAVTDRLGDRAEVEAARVGAVAESAEDRAQDEQVPRGGGREAALAERGGRAAGQDVDGARDQQHAQRVADVLGAAGAGERPQPHEGVAETLKRTAGQDRERVHAGAREERVEERDHAVATAKRELAADVDGAVRVDDQLVGAGRGATSHGDRRRDLSGREEQRVRLVERRRHHGVRRAELLQVHEGAHEGAEGIAELLLADLAVEVEHRRAGASAAVRGERIQRASRPRARRCPADP
jgi:hypothetical protein